MSSPQPPLKLPAGYQHQGSDDERHTEYGRLSPAQQGDILSRVRKSGPLPHLNHTPRCSLTTMVLRVLVYIPVLTQIVGLTKVSSCAFFSCRRSAVHSLSTEERCKVKSTLCETVQNAYKLSLASYLHHSSYLHHT